jgi:hypothetical protein
MDITICFHESYPSRIKKRITFDSPKKLYEYLKSFDEISVSTEIDKQIHVYKPAALSCRTKIFYIETNLPTKKINFEYYFLHKTETEIEIKNKIYKAVRNKEIESHDYIFIFSHGLIILFIDRHQGSYWEYEKYNYVEEMIDKIIKLK